MFTFSGLGVCNTQNVFKKDQQTLHAKQGEAKMDVSQLR